jgi:hypothetical protein
MKREKEETNNIIITEVILLTVVTVFIMVLCKRVVNKPIHYAKAYLA